MSLMKHVRERQERAAQEKTLAPPKPRPKRTSTLELILAAIPDGRVIALSFAYQIALRDERFQALLRDYDADTTKDLGDLCEQHNVPPAEFLAEINKEAFPFIEESMKLAHTVSTQIVAKRLPKVVERGLIEGAKKEGIQDRHFILQKEGFHVAPKGATISINNVNAQAGGLPSFEDETKELSDILQIEDDHLLTEGETDFIEAEEEEEIVEKVEIPA